MDVDGYLQHQILGPDDRMAWMGMHFSRAVGSFIDAASGFYTAESSAPIKEDSMLEMLEVVQTRVTAVPGCKPQ